MDDSHQLNVDTPWQKLSTIAILYFVMRSLRSVLGNIVYLIPVIAYSYSNMQAQPHIWLPAILLLCLLLLLSALWSFKVYRFRLSNKVLEIQSGIFNKKHLNLPFERIQNVKIEQPIYYRLTGYACLQLDTAGSAKQEAKLVALPLGVAEQLKRQILDTTSEHCQVQGSDSKDVNAEVAPTANIKKEQVINKRSLTDLILHGITNNRVWLVLGGLSPFYNDIANIVNQELVSYGLNMQEMFNLQTQSFMQIGIYALSIGLIILLTFLSLSVISAIISFYGYTLSKVENRYIRRSGLFTKHEVSMPLSRLQLIIQKQDWLDVVLKRVNLNLEQISGQLKQSEPSASSNKIIVPSITLQQSQELIKDIYPNNQLFETSYSPISSFYLVRYIGYYLFPLFCIAETIAMIEQKMFFALLALAFMLLASAIVYLRWRRWGYAFDDTYIYLRRGLLGVDYYCFAQYKIQQCQFRQSLMMKKRGLATNKYVLASGSLTLPMLPESIALKLINHCLLQVESSKRSWM